MHKLKLICIFSLLLNIQTNYTMHETNNEKAIIEIKLHQIKRDVYLLANQLELLTADDFLTPLRVRIARNQEQLVKLRSAKIALENQLKQMDLIKKTNLCK